MPRAVEWEQFSIRYPQNCRVQKAQSTALLFDETQFHQLPLKKLIIFSKIFPIYASEKDQKEIDACPEAVSSQDAGGCSITPSYSNQIRNFKFSHFKIVEAVPEDWPNREPPSKWPTTLYNSARGPLNCDGSSKESPFISCIPQGCATHLGWPFHPRPLGIVCTTLVYVLEDLHFVHA